MYDNKNSSFPKFQINEITNKKINIYNGTESFILNNTNKALDVQIDTSTVKLSKQSFFRQSWANLLSILPHLITNDSIQKEIADTTILKSKKIAIKFYYPKKRVNSFTGFYNLNVDTIKWRYELIIDYKTFLPEQFNVNIQTPNNNKDFIKVSFNKVSVNPKMPTEKSWFFSTYNNLYPNKTGKRNDLITPPKKMPPWSIPLYNSKKNFDTLTSNTLNGKVILLVFWIKGCSHCMAMLPKLNKLQNEFNRDSFELITINGYDTKEDVGFFSKKFSNTYKMCYDGKKLADSLGIYGFPMALLLDKKSIIQYVVPFDYHILKNKIVELIN